MTKEQADNLLWMKDLGIDTSRNTYDRCVAILIEKYILVTDALEMEEQERFKKEIERIKKNTN